MTALPAVAAGVALLAVYVELSATLLLAGSRRAARLIGPVAALYGAALALCVLSS